MRLPTAILTALLGVAPMSMTAVASTRQIPSIEQLRSYSIRQLQNCALLNGLRAAYSVQDVRLEHWPKAKVIVPWYSANCLS